MTGLTSLTCSPTDDSDYALMLSPLTSLRRLRIGSLRDVMNTDTYTIDLPEVLRCLPSLTQLAVVFWTPHFGLITNLTSLELHSHCRRQYGIGMQQLPVLQRLKIRGVRHAPCLAMQLSKCTQLQELILLIDDVEDMETILLGLMNGTQRIRNMTWTVFQYLTIQGLRILESYAVTHRELPQLSELNIYVYTRARKAFAQTKASLRHLLCTPGNGLSFQMEAEDSHGNTF